VKMLLGRVATSLDASTYRNEKCTCGAYNCKNCSRILGGVHASVLTIQREGDGRDEGDAGEYEPGFLHLCPQLGRYRYESRKSTQNPAPFITLLGTLNNLIPCLQTPAASLRTEDHVPATSALPWTCPVPLLSSTPRPNMPTLLRLKLYRRPSFTLPEPATMHAASVAEAPGLQCSR